MALEAVYCVVLMALDYVGILHDAGRWFNNLGAIAVFVYINFGGGIVGTFLGAIGGWRLISRKDSPPFWAMSDESTAQPNTASVGNRARSDRPPTTVTPKTAEVRKKKP
jgi:hypothetical protein